MDVFATYWQRLTRIVGWDAARIFRGRGGGREKLVIVAISLNLHTESRESRDIFCYSLHMNDVVNDVDI